GSSTTTTTTLSISRVSSGGIVSSASDTSSSNLSRDISITPAILPPTGGDVSRVVPDSGKQEVMDFTRLTNLPFMARSVAIARHRWSRRLAMTLAIVIVAGFGAWLGI